MMRSFVLSLLLIITPAIASAVKLAPWLKADEATCGRVSMPTMGTASYCLQAGSRNHVVVSFPGVFNTAEAYKKLTPRALAQSFKTFGAQPSVLTISIGQVAFLTGRMQPSGKTDVDEVVDALSAILKSQGFDDPRVHPGTVDFWGDSMGGHNLVMILMRNPQLYRRLALTCPALTTQSPWVNQIDWLRNMDRDGEWYRSLSYKEAMVHFFGSEDVWRENSPMFYVQKHYRPLTQPQPIYMGRTQRDYFGFNSGGVAFRKLLEARGHKVVFHETVGQSHCDVHTDALAQFFLQ